MCAASEGAHRINATGATTRTASRAGAVALCACLSGFAPAALAEFGGSLAATTDYVYRGISQTRGKAAFQADIHYRTTSAWTLGAWATTLDASRDPGTPLELDLYLSRNWALDPNWDAQVTLTHYMYPDDDRAASYAYNEVTASLIYQSRLAATVAWSPDSSRFAYGWLAQDQTAISYELSATQSLFHELSATGGAGYYELPELNEPGYWFWNAGLSWSVGGAQLAVSYIDTDAAAVRRFGYEQAGSRWMGTLLWRF
jgi:uncharacterized protein (TIGR02001 family)